MNCKYSFTVVILGSHIQDVKLWCPVQTLLDHIVNILRLTRGFITLMKIMNKKLMWDEIQHLVYHFRLKHVFYYTVQKVLLDNTLLSVKIDFICP